MRLSASDGSNSFFLHRILNHIANPNMEEKIGDVIRNVTLLVYLSL